MIIIQSHKLLSTEEFYYVLYKLRDMKRRGLILLDSYLELSAITDDEHDIKLENKPATSDEHLCNNCGTEMEDLVLSYTVKTLVTTYGDEVKIAVNGEPGAPHYYFYICPKCGNVQAYRVETEEE